MAEPKTTNQQKVRLMVRIDIPETTPDRSTELYTTISNLVAGFKDASVELSMLPVISLA